MGRFVFLLLLALALGGMHNAHADYLAYAVGEKSKIPLPQSIGKIDAKYLLNLEWGEFDGARSRVGVLQVDNNSSSSSFAMAGPNGDTYSWSYDNANQVPVNGIEAIVTDVMNNTGRFRLVERQALASILQEQDLASSGRVAKPSGAKTGNVLGAQYLVQVVVTDYEAKVSGKRGGLGALTRSVPVLGGVGIGGGQGRVGMNFRLIDAQTSEVVYTQQVESVIKESSLTFGGVGFSSAGALGGFMSSYAKTPIGQAVIAGINKGVYELVQQIGSEPASGSVIQTKGNQVWVNIGSDNVNVGDVLMVMAKGEELIDPDTGISLGSSDTQIGSIKVSDSQEKFSIADAVSLNGTVNRGDKVVSTVTPAQIEFASKWNKPRRGKF